MKNYDEIANLIEEINAKLKEMDKQMIIVEDIKPHFGAMDTFIPELESAYKEFDESLSNGIIRTQAINKIVSIDAVEGYYDIFQELNSKCTDIINDLLESVDILKESPEVEVLDMTPISNNTNDAVAEEVQLTENSPIITQEFIDRQVSMIRPIETIDNPRDVIPLPTPVQPEIEVLEM